MQVQLGKSLFLSIVVVTAAACAQEANPGAASATDVTTTTAAASNASAAQKVAATRCRRAAECNRIGAGQMYADKADCLDREQTAAMQVSGGCPAGVDKARLDRCLGMLDDEHCDANLGPVTTMNECKAYCASP